MDHRTLRFTHEGKEKRINYSLDTAHQDDLNLVLTTEDSEQSVLMKDKVENTWNLSDQEKEK